MSAKEAEDFIDVEYVKWFSEIDKNSVSVAGGKGANLGEMYNSGVPVPPGFVVTAQAYEHFIEHSNLYEKMKDILENIDYNDTKKLDEATKKVREMILKSEMPQDLEKEVIEAYGNLSTNPNYNVTAHEFLKRFPESIFVAVRSSATAEDLADASFAGQQDSFLNIKGNMDLIETIKKCFASLYTSRATYYRHKKGFKHEDTSLAVVVQKMVDADRAGVVFSKDPTFKNDNVIVEAVFGLGPGIVSGIITPDKYVVSKNMEISDKKISDKKIAITRDAGGNEVQVKLSREKSLAQVLKDSEIIKIANISLKLEKHYQNPQDIEFAVENGEIYVVQTRAITTIKNRIENVKELNGEIILSGLAASPGIGSGKVKIINDMNDLEKIETGDILVTEMTNPDMVVTMQKSAAIITDEGGLTAHAAIVSREMGIPCVVGTSEATKILSDGDEVTVDGFNGKVYKGIISESKKKEVSRVETKTKTKIKVMVDLPSFAKRASETGIKEVGLLRLEGIIAESGKHPNFFLTNGKFHDYEEIIFNGIKGIAEYFNELWVRTSDIRTDEFQNLEGAPKEVEANPMLGMHGIRYSLKHPELLKAELKALKRIAEKGKMVGIFLPQIINLDEVVKVKKMLKEIDFPKHKIGVMIETPAAVQLIRDFCEEGIDFVSFGTNDLTQYMLAIDRGNKDVQDLYDEMHPAILYQLDYVIRVAKRNSVETSICGQAGSRKEMVKFLVERGIDSISVNADVASEIAAYVSELESGTLKEEKDFFDKTLQPIKEPMSLGELQDPEETESEEKQQGMN